MAGHKSGGRYVVEERSGDQFAALALAQQAAINPLAADLVAIIHELLAAGQLASIAGKIEPRSTDEEPSQ